MFKLPTLQGIENSAVRRFRLPQFSSPSQQVNQANSEVMQGAESTPSSDAGTGSGDIYSGAKQGVEKIKTAIKPMDTQNPQASPSFNRAAEMVNDANSYATEEAAPQDVYTPPQMTDISTPEHQVGKPQTGIRTGLEKSQGLSNEAANAARGAQNPQSQDLDALRQAQITQANAQNALAGFDPTKQPVSKLRKTAGIATGIATGVLGGGPIKGIQAYDAITRKPALEKQQQLGRVAQTAGVNVGTAEKTVQAADKMMNTQNDVSKNLQDIAKTQQTGDIYTDTGQAKAQAETTLATANARNANAEADVRSRPPEPKISTVGENDSAFKTVYDKANNSWSIEPLSPKSGDKGIQKLSAGDEPIVRGWLGKHSLDPNSTLDGYRAGDPKASALVLQALHDEAVARNPGMVFDSAQLIPTYGPTGDATGAILFDPRTRKMTPVTPAEMGLGGGTFKTPPKPLDQTSNGQYKGAINTQKVVDGMDGVIEKLYPTSKDPLIQQHAKELREQLGPLAGRISDAGVDVAGIQNEEIAGLLQELQSAAIFAASSHSGRITPAFIDEFKKSMGGVKQAPENLRGRLKIISEVADDVRKTIEDTNPNATQVAAQKILEARQNPVKVGAVVTVTDPTTKKPKQITITVVHPDGSYDGKDVVK